MMEYATLAVVLGATLVAAGVVWVCHRSWHAYKRTRARVDALKRWIGGSD